MTVRSFFHQHRVAWINERLWGATCELDYHTENTSYLFHYKCLYECGLIIKDCASNLAAWDPCKRVPNVT